jgi:hypothetical protein
MNIYTTNSITTVDIDINTGILDQPNIFPPLSNYFLTITPNVGEDIAAKFFRCGPGTIPLELAMQGDPDSHTQFPSKFEWRMPSNVINQPVAYHKIVLQDSENPTNDPNFTGGGTNQVYVWIYFGSPILTTTTALEPFIWTQTSNHLTSVDIDYDPDPLTLNDVLQPGSVGSSTSVGTINTITI